MPLTFFGEGVDDDARQQRHQQHHRCQEERSARRPARQAQQSSAHAALHAAATPEGRAGKPHVERAVHRPQRRQRPPTRPLITLR